MAGEGVTNPKANAVLVEALGSSLRYGGSALEQVPDLLKQILTEGGWRDFQTSRGEQVHYERFADFVTTPPLKGLGATLDLIERIVKDDAELLDLLDQALQNPVGRHQDSDNITVLDTAGGRGTSQQYALRKLRKDAPELHAEVLAGRLSAHAAMVKGGFRPRTFTVRRDRPDSIARALRKNLTAEQLAEVRKLLGE